MLSMLDCPIDFVATTTLKRGGGVKENKDVRDRKILFNKHSLSTVFVQDCSWYQDYKINHSFLVSMS